MNIYTAGFEGYYIKPDKQTPSMYAVVTEGKGGKIPDVLTGLFTSKDNARKAITSYLLSKPRKVVTNGEEINKG